MPTIAGMRRRGYTPEAIRRFCAKSAWPSSTARSTCRCWRTPCARISTAAHRGDGCAAAAEIVMENFPEGKVEELEAINNPEDPAAGTRKVPFSRELYIEQDDFREDPPKKFFRLGPGAKYGCDPRTSSNASEW